MRTQKNWFKMTLMTLAAVGLMIGAFTLSAQAQDDQSGDQKEEEEKIIVILTNQFEEGRYVEVEDLKLLCVPTYKEIYDGDGKQTDGQTDDGKTDDGQTYDHLACYKVKDYEEPSDGGQGDDKKY